MTAILKYLRHHAIALLALVCSLLAMAGGAYAAFDLPNRSIDPVKFNPHLIGGVVRVWAVVAGNGHLLHGSSGAKSGSTGLPGVYVVEWRRPRAVFQRCAGIATITLAPGIDGFADAAPAGHNTVVHTYNPQGQPVGLPFSVVVVC